MLEFVIINDNLLFQTKITSIIDDFMQKEKLAYHIYMYESYDASAYKLLKNCSQKLRIYILDMETPDGNVQDYVRKIRKKDASSFIIGMGSPKQELIALKYAFLSYFNYFNEQFLDQIKQTLMIIIKKEMNHKMLRFKERDIQYGIHIADIEYLQRYQKKKTIIQTQKCSYLVSFSLEELKHKLPEEFVYQNRDRVINFAQYQLKNMAKHTVIVDSEQTKTAKSSYPQKGKRYTEEEKQHAINMYYNYKTESEIQKEIGMSINTLRIWVAKDKKEKFENQEKEHNELQQEIQILCNKNAKLETENEILKKEKRKSEQDCERFRKAVHILSEPSEDK